MSYLVPPFHRFWKALTSVRDPQGKKKRETKVEKPRCCWSTRRSGRGQEQLTFSSYQASKCLKLSWTSWDSFNDNKFKLHDWQILEKSLHKKTMHNKLFGKRKELLSQQYDNKHVKKIIKFWDVKNTEIMQRFGAVKRLCCRWYFWSVTKST